MAKKGQKQQKYDDELIETIITERFKKGTSVKKLSMTYNVPEGTIETWIYKFNKRGTTERQRRGRPEIDPNQDWKEKYEILKKYLEFLEEEE